MFSSCRLAASAAACVCPRIWPAAESSCAPRGPRRVVRLLGGLGRRLARLLGDRRGRLLGLRRQVVDLLLGLGDHALALLVALSGRALGLLAGVRHGALGAARLAPWPRTPPSPLRCGPSRLPSSPYRPSRPVPSRSSHLTSATVRRAAGAPRFPRVPVGCWYTARSTQQILTPPRHGGPGGEAVSSARDAIRWRGRGPGREGESMSETAANQPEQPAQPASRPRPASCRSTPGCTPQTARWGA